MNNNFDSLSQESMKYFEYLENESKSYKDIGDRLKFLRQCFGLSQSKFSEKCGLRQSSIACYEAKLREPRSSSISLIARECGVSFDWLQEGIGEMIFDISKFVSNLPSTKVKKEVMENIDLEEMHDNIQVLDLIELVSQLDPSNYKLAYDVLLLMKKRK